MRVAAPSLALSLALCLPSGCTNTGADHDALIPNEFVERAVSVVTLGTLLGSELGLLAANPPDGFSTCPGVLQEGDEYTFTYGDGCVPDSGLTTELLVGTINLTIAGGSGAFLGTTTALGVGTNLLTGSVTGSQSSAGDLFTVDLDLTDGVWERDTATSTLNGFLEITGDQDNVSLFVDSASLLGSSSPAMRVDVGDITVPRVDLASCFVPADGTMTLIKDEGRADLTFSADSHASGNITANFNDRDPATVGPCPD